MFNQELNPQSQRSIQTQLREPQYSSSDLQYEICSKFMKMTSEKLYQKQLELIQMTSKFIQKISDNLMQKDISSTQESLSFEPFLDEEDPFSQPTKSRLLLRKSQSNSSLRRSDSGIPQALKEVKRKCSEKTLSIITNMTDQFRKIKEKLSNSDKMEKQLKKMDVKFSASEEEMLLLKKRVSDLEKENIQAKQQSDSLKKRLKQMNVQLNTKKLSMSRSSDNLKVVPNTANITSLQRMKKHLQEKEMHIFKKEKQIKMIQEKIQSSLQGIVQDKSCEKCCVLVKRIKESIMKYRSYLQEQANLCEAVYHNYKKLFL